MGKPSRGQLVRSLDAAAPVPQLRANLRGSMTELAAPQISSLMEALPGIAAVLRSPVANAIVALSRAGAGLEDYRLVEAEELLRYGVRRNLLTQDEVDRILAEIREALSHRPAKASPPMAEKPKKAAISPAAVPETKAPVAAVTKAAPAPAPRRRLPRRQSRRPLPRLSPSPPQRRPARRRQSRWRRRSLPSSRPSVARRSRRRNRARRSQPPRRSRSPARP